MSGIFERPDTRMCDVSDIPNSSQNKIDPCHRGSTRQFIHPIWKHARRFLIENAEVLLPNSIT